MNRYLAFFFSSLLFIGSLVATDVDEHLSLQAEIVYLRRSKLQDECFAQEDVALPFVPLSECNCPAETCRMNSQDTIHDMHHEAGMRLSVYGMIDQQTTLEGRYTGFFHWKGRASAVSADGELRFPIREKGVPFQEDNGTNDYVDADAAKELYTTDLWHAEFNYWNHVTPRRVDYFSVSWVMGARYIHLNEEFKLTYFKDNNVSNYTVRTKNQCIGLQFGGDFRANPYKWLTWGGEAKIGGLYTRSQQRQLMLDDNNTTVLRDFDNKGHTGTFLGEIEVFLRFYPSNWLTIKIGYQVLFLQNVALAPEQAKLTSSGSGLDDKGHALYHGGFAGLGINF